MFSNIAPLLQRNPDVFAEKDPTRRRALIEEFYTEDCVFHDPNNGVHRGREERLTGLREWSRLLILTFSTSPLPSPMCPVMGVESAGYPAGQVRLLRTLERTSSLLGRAA
jgi:hypothetical protein